MPRQTKKPVVTDLGTFREFLRDPRVIGEGGYIEEEVVFVGDAPLDTVEVDELDASVVVKIHSGILVQSEDKLDDPLDLPAAFRWWLELRDRIRLIVSVPRDKERDLRAAIKKIKGAKIESSQ